MTIYPFVEFNLRKFVHSTDRVLDVGCGAGQYRAVCPGEYIGLDRSNERYSEELDRRVDIVASATRIPVPNESFDVVFTVGAFYQIDDHMAALHEFHRILKPGGRLLIFDYNRRTQRNLKEGVKLPEWTQWRLRRMVRKSGFLTARLLTTKCGDENIVEKFFKLIRQELFGTWSIVLALKE